MEFDKYHFVKLFLVLIFFEIVRSELTHTHFLGLRHLCAFGFWQWVQFLAQSLRLDISMLTNVCPKEHHIGGLGPFAQIKRVVSCRKLSGSPFVASWNFIYWGAFLSETAQETIAETMTCFTRKCLGMIHEAPIGSYHQIFLEVWVWKLVMWYCCIFLQYSHYKYR